jgi:YebC/PmpR family DNA-binding regulatory protein
MSIKSIEVLSSAVCYNSPVSGHSKWSTIKHQKGAKDIARGKLFSKLSKAISVAVNTGGGSDPDSNYKLRIAIDLARQANMPKENIARAISKSSAEGDSQEAVYEGFGPSGVAVVVEVVTDNRNRTAQEIKNLFERAGGSLSGPGSVLYNFEAKGLILLQKSQSPQDQMLKIIDLGVEDIEETEDGLEVYTHPKELYQVRESLEKAGFKVLRTELLQKPISIIEVSDINAAKKVFNFLSDLEEHPDVQMVFSNANLPSGILGA